LDIGDLKLFGICHLVLGIYQKSAVDADATLDSMKMKSGSIVVLVTCGSEEEALKIANTLVEDHLAACVNLVSPIRSIYRWEGKIWDEKEWLLVIKTQKQRFGEVEKKVKSLHSYSVPEIISLPIIEGSTSYLNWIKENTK